MIARFFHDVDDTIVTHGGEVHAYIGDELIATWPLRDGAQDAACLRAVLAVRDRIADLADSYVNEFGVAPAFRAALHCGPVTVSEVGRSKQQIGYFGDTVNVTARLEDQAKQLDRDLLISGDLMERLDLPDDMAVDDLGPITLRGRVAPIHVLALARTGEDLARCAPSQALPAK